VDAVIAAATSKKWLAAFLALGLLGGCMVPVTGIQVPRTTPKGTQITAGGLGVSVSGPSPNDLPLIAEGAMRYGVSERVDLGLRFRASVLEGGAKVQLVRDAVEVSVAPSLIVGAEGLVNAAFDENTLPDANVQVLAARLRVYVGTNVDHPFAVFVAPSFDAGVRIFEAGDYPSRAYANALLAPGAAVGLVFSPQKTVHLLLEAGVLFPVGGPGTFTDGPNGPTSQLRLGPGDNRLEISAGLIFGSFN
jgi:hypothetical protein